MRLTVLFVAVLFALTCGPGVQAVDRPNLLIITVDDMSADSLGCFGCPLPETSPNIDRLAAESLRFQYAHVQVGNCMPGRNVMWSGRMPHNNRVEGFYQVPEANDPVLCDLMKQGGYFTAIRGKVSHSTPYHPYDWDLVLDTLPDGSKAHIKDARSYGLSTSQGISAAQQAKRPFCLMVNISDPHKPFYAQDGRTGETIADPHPPSRVFTPDEVPIPGFLFDDPVVRKELSHYYSSVRRADDCVGEVLQALNAAGHAEDTLVMFLSDHGMALPFAKTQLYHHSTHTPLMVRWPGVTSPNSWDREHMVSAVDFLPTLLDVCGLPHPATLDGRSFAPLLRGETQADRAYVIKEYNENAGGSRDPMRAVQTKQFLYLFNPWSNGERVMATATTGTPTYRRFAQLAKTNADLAARHDLYQFRVPEELYDVAADPDCLHNLRDDPSFRDDLTRLQATLATELERTADPILPVFQQRHDAAAREAYTQRVEQESDARRNSKPKKAARAANPNRKQAAPLISLNLPERITPGETLTVRIAHELPRRLGEQQLHVTLKGGEAGRRLQRVVVTISGEGTAILPLDVPADATGPFSLAAFVGSDFENNLQHIQSPAISAD